jgi:DNA-directed RNA polymerase specialized sigma24 family protein
LSRWRGGDTCAGAGLIHAHFQVVRAMFRRIPSEDAEDLAQETFLACLISGSRLRDAANIRSFLAAVARHQLYKYRRRLQRSDQRSLLAVDSLAVSRSSGRTSSTADFSKKS